MTGNCVLMCTHKANSEILAFFFNHILPTLAQRQLQRRAL